jgi:hypothetical protein
MGKKCSNIEYGKYKDYQNVRMDSFDEDKQKIWNRAVNQFHLTHQRITDKELCEFDKIYISHYASKGNDETGGYFYTTYQIVSPCNNVKHDREHTLYIDKKNKIVILETYNNHYGKLNEITEEILKAATSKHAKYYARVLEEEFHDELANRTDRWLQKYNEWLGIV